MRLVGFLLLALALSALAFLFWRVTGHWGFVIIDGLAVVSLLKRPGNLTRQKRLGR